MESSSQWTPTELLLSQSLLLLQALRDPSRHDHQAALNALKTDAASPDFVLHMLHIFARGNVTIDIRQLSGLVLKNYSLQHFGSLAVHIQMMIQKEIMHALSDPIHDVRKTACILIGKIASMFSLNIWSQLFYSLIAQLESAVFLEVEGALSAIKLICEDACDKLANGSDSALLTTLIPRLITTFKHSEQIFRLRALESIIAILTFLPASVTPIPININAFIQELSALAADPSPEIRKSVCEAISTLATHDLGCLDRYFSSVSEFMLHATGDSVEAVALESCEFWSILAMTPEGQEGMQPYLPRLIPLLISRMRLTDEQITVDRIEEEEHASGEKSLNIKPLHYRGKNGGEDGEDDEEDMSVSWTMRRQSAAVLDNIAIVFDVSFVLPYALNSVSQFLQSDDIWNREAGMLALGALSKGCQDDLGDFVKQVYPYLLESLSNSIPEVRSISCWTLGRFCYVVLDQEDERIANENLAKLLQALLPAMLDPKPKVQSACCSALCTVMEEAGERIRFFTGPIVANIDIAFKLYGVKNSLLLCDTIGTLADQIGPELKHPQLTEKFLPHLMSHFDRYDDSNVYLFPIMECLTSVVSAIGAEFNGYAATTFHRCVRIITNTMAANAAADAGQWQSPTNADAPPKDFAICALDVISSLAEGLGSPRFGALIQGNENNVLEILFCCMKDSMDAVRQSAFSLAGDLSKSCTSLLLPVKNQLFTLAVGNLDPDVPMVCNNASWTIGELAIRMDGNDMAPFIPRVMQHLIQIIQKVLSLPDSLKQNVAITIGRLCVTNTDACAEYLPEFFVNWCKALRTLGPSIEQEHAYSGLCAAVSSNPLIFSITGTFDAFILACANLETAPEEPLNSNISNILRALLSVSESSWRTLMATHRGEIEHLIEIFNLRN